MLTARIGIAHLTELEAIVETRVSGQELMGRSATRPSLRRLAELYERFGDDVRGIEHALYADYERMRQQHKEESHATL